MLSSIDCSRFSIFTPKQELLSSISQPPRDFHPFPDLSRQLKNCPFSSAKVKNTTLVDLKDIAKNRFQKCFDRLYTHWHKYAAERGAYFEGGYV